METTASKTKVERLKHLAAHLLRIPDGEINSPTARSNDRFAFRRSCVVLVLNELGISRGDIAAAFDKSPSWVNKAITEVEQRAALSSPFRLSLSRTIDEIHLDTPVTQRFRTIRRIISNETGTLSPDALSLSAAALTLAAMLGLDDGTEGQ